LYYFNLASRKFMQSRAKSCKVRLFPYVMGSHGKSRKVLLFPNFSPKLPAKSCQVIGSHGQSCQVRGIPRTKGGLHSYAQLCTQRWKKNRIFFILTWKYLSFKKRIVIILIPYGYSNSVLYLIAVYIYAYIKYIIHKKIQLAILHCVRKWDFWGYNDV